MTDTNSDLAIAINRLMSSCTRLNKYQHRATVDIEDVELVLLTLEAERQRADDADKRLAMKQRIANKRIEIGAANLQRIEQLEAEILKLKGDQVPVITCYSCQKVMTRDQHAEADGFCTHCNVEVEND